MHVLTKKPISNYKNMFLANKIMKIINNILKWYRTKDSKTNIDKLHWINMCLLFTRKSAAMELANITMDKNNGNL